MQQDAQNERIGPLEVLLRDYYTASLIGAAMEDPTEQELRDYEERMRGLQERCEELLGMKEQEGRRMAVIDGEAETEALGTFYIEISVYGGFVRYLEEGACENGAVLLAVNGGALSDLSPTQKGFREGAGLYLFRVMSRSKPDAVATVERVRLRAVSRFLEKGEEPPSFELLQSG